MKTILVPTDFNTSALDCVESLCRQFEGQELGFIFMHMFKLSDSMSDLLMLSRRSREFELISDDFYNRCNELKNRYPQVKFIRAEFLYGSTMSMFKNFIDGNEVGHILHVDNSNVSKINKSSIDPSVLIARCGLPVISILKKVDMTVEEPVEQPESELNIA